MRQDLVRIAGSLPPATPLPDLVRATPAHEGPAVERATTVTIPQVVAAKRGHRRPKRRRRWPWAIALVLAIVAGAWSTWTYAVPHYASAPNVLGMQLSDARDRLESSGLHVRVGHPTPSIRYPAGTVARQSIAPGSRIRRGTDVLLQVSTGPPFVPVPKVVGLPLSKARSELVDGHLGIDEKHRYSETVAKGDVISQAPVGGTQARYGSHVRLVVSDGPPPVKIPVVTGRSVDQAKAALNAVGFIVERIDRFSDTVPRGDVIRQHPAKGTAPKGSTVTIVVSKGPQYFPMPDVEGMNGSAAEQELRSLGLDVHTVVIPSSSGNTVVGQAPAPGTTMHQGDSATIYVA